MTFIEFEKMVLQTIDMFINIAFDTFVSSIRVSVNAHDLTDTDRLFPSLLVYAFESVPDRPAIYEQSYRTTFKTEDKCSNMTFDEPLITQSKSAYINTGPKSTDKSDKRDKMLELQCFFIKKISTSNFQK